MGRGCIEALRGINVAIMPRAQEVLSTVQVTATDRECVQVGVNTIIRACYDAGRGDLVRFCKSDQSGETALCIGGFGDLQTAIKVAGFQPLTSNLEFVKHIAANWKFFTRGKTAMMRMASSAINDDPVFLGITNAEVSAVDVNMHFFSFWRGVEGDDTVLVYEK